MLMVLIPAQTLIQSLRDAHGPGSSLDLYLEAGGCSQPCADPDPFLEAERCSWPHTSPDPYPEAEGC